MDQNLDLFADKKKGIWAFGGGKGGAGRSFNAASLAVLLAQKNCDVILIDCDLGAANLHTMLGIAPPEKSVHDFLKGNVKHIAEIASKTPYGNLRLISGAWDGFGAANPNTSIKHKLFRQLMTLDCDYLLIDTGSGTGFNNIDFFLLADVGILVVTPEPSSVELMYRYLDTVLYRKLKALAPRVMFDNFIEEANKIGRAGNRIGVIRAIVSKLGDNYSAPYAEIKDDLFDMNLKVIVNQARYHQDQHLGQKLPDVIKKFYGFNAEYIGVVPYDERVVKSERMLKPFVREYSTSEAAASFTLALDRLMVQSLNANKEKLLNLI